MHAIRYTSKRKQSLSRVFHDILFILQTPVNNVTPLTSRHNLHFFYYYLSSDSLPAVALAPLPPEDGLITNLTILYFFLLFSKCIINWCNWFQVWKPNQTMDMNGPAPLFFNSCYIVMQRRSWVSFSPPLVSAILDQTYYLTNVCPSVRLIGIQEAVELRDWIARSYHNRSLLNAFC